MLALAVVLAAGLPSPAPAQPANPLDPRISALVAAVSAQRLRADDERLVAFGTRNLFSDAHGKARGVGAARDWLVAQFTAGARASGGRMRVAVQRFVQPKTPRIPRDVETFNVLATLPGDDPAAATIVISGHYDSRNDDGNDPNGDAPGADDNGSGTIAVLEAARVMAPLHFRNTIVFAEYDGEEQGLFGSAYHAKSLRDAGVRVAANLNNDIIGSSLGHDGVRRPTDVRLFSEALPAGATAARVNAMGSENDSPSRELARFVKEAGEAYVAPMRANLVFRGDRLGRGGDQESFTALGFAAVRFVEANETWEHQHENPRVEKGVEYGDLLKYMDWDYVANVTRMNVAAAAALALGPPPPAEATLLARGFTYDTILQWKAGPGAAAFEVVWRATWEPVWTHSRLVGNVTTVNLKDLNKDDWIFGVRALDGSGLRSVAVFPQHVR